MLVFTDFTSITDTGMCLWYILVVVVLCISVLAFLIELRKHINRERELRRTNDMYIVHLSIFPTLGVFWIVLAIVCAVALLLIYLEYIGIKL